MVTDDTFLAMMEITALHHITVGTVLQLDGAPSHFSNCVCAFLGKEFPDHWIGGGGGPIPWHPSLSRFDYS